MTTRLFSFLTCACLLLAAFPTSSTADDEVLGRFVGTWNLKTPAKPAKWSGRVPIWKKKLISFQTYASRACSLLSCGRPVADWIL